MARKTKDILRETNGPEPVSRHKWCKCTGPWDCRCEDVLASFYSDPEEEKIWQEFDDLLWERIESGNGVDHQKFLQLCKEKFKISRK